MTDNIPEVNVAELPPIKIAFILDGEVVDILHTDERLAAIFTSNPTIMDVTSLINENQQSITTITNNTTIDNNNNTNNDLVTKLTNENKQLLDKLTQLEHQNEILTIKHSYELKMKDMEIQL